MNYNRFVNGMYFSMEGKTEKLIQNQLPVAEIRSHFPAMQQKYNENQVVFFNGPSGSQMLKESINAMVKYCYENVANVHEQNPNSQNTMRITEKARQAMADFLGAKPSEIAFGQNTTSHIFAFSRTVSRTWQKGHNVIVTEIDHRANVDPWIEAAKDKGAEIRWIRLDKKRFTLDLSHLDTLIDHNTKVIAIGLASNGLGTVNLQEIEAIKKRAKAIGTLVIVDAVHAVPHFAIDFTALDVDALFCSGYKFFGPHIGIAVIREDLFKKLPVYKVKPAPTEPPGCFENGCQNHEAQAGILPIIDFIESLGTGDSRRTRIVDAMNKIEEYEQFLAERIRKTFAAIPEITLYQAPSDVLKTPTIAFTIKDHTPKEICKTLCEKHGIYAGDGHFYAMTIGEVLDLNKDGGWIRIGMAPYTTLNEVDFFIQTIKDIISNT